MCARRNLMNITAISSFLLILFLSGTGFAADAAWKDDAYHYQHSGIDDQFYNEWWYFNGITNDTQFLITYFLIDPENISGLRKIRVLAVVLEDGQQTAIGLEKSQGFGADRNLPNVELANSSISALNEPNLTIWGTANDVITGTPMRWDLSYQPALAPWFGISLQSQVGHLQGDWMKWLVYMPSANVTGDLTLGNRTIKIRGRGYHDHNWGRWAFNDPKWNWAQASQPEDGFSVTLGDVQSERRNTILGIKYDGEAIKFSERQIKLNYTDFAFDPVTARTYATGYEVEADNGDYQLKMGIKALKNVPLPVDYPAPMPSVEIFEQVSRFQGILQPRSRPAYQFDLLGFSEYTTHKLHPIIGRVSGNGTNITITATNQRSGQMKTTAPVAGGWFSIDADYADYLANSSHPWVAAGDKVLLEAKDAGGNVTSTELLIDMTLDRQEVEMNS